MYRRASIIRWLLPRFAKFQSFLSVDVIIVQSTCSLMFWPILRSLELDPRAWFSTVFCHCGLVRLIHMYMTSMFHTRCFGLFLSYIHFYRFIWNTADLLRLSVLRHFLSILSRQNSPWPECGLFLCQILLANCWILYDAGWSNSKVSLPLRGFPTFMMQNRYND